MLLKKGEEQFVWEQCSASNGKTHCSMGTLVGWHPTLTISAKGKKHEMLKLDDDSKICMVDKEVSQ